jgi:hypothetical protein
MGERWENDGRTSEGRSVLERCCGGGAGHGTGMKKPPEIEAALQLLILKTKEMAI